MPGDSPIDAQYECSGEATSAAEERSPPAYTRPEEPYLILNEPIPWRQIKSIIWANAALVFLHVSTAATIATIFAVFLRGRMYPNPYPNSGSHPPLAFDHASFMEVIRALDTGNSTVSSWVTSKDTPSWLYGYVPENTPQFNPGFLLWNAKLSATKHSVSPLVFPPPSIPSNPWMAVHILGYKVTSRDTSGLNGWWKMTGLDRFAVQDGQIEFWAKGLTWIRVRAKFDVTVCYIEAVRRSPGDPL